MNFFALDLVGDGYVQFDFQKVAVSDDFVDAYAFCCPSRIDVLLSLKNIKITSNLSHVMAHP